MQSDLDSYRKRQTEQERVSALMSMLPRGRRSVLDIGARDGFITNRLDSLFDVVVGLDIRLIVSYKKKFLPCIGDVVSLGFKDRAFDTILCTEVLEHIPPSHLQAACHEMIRVANRDVVVGVPYRQDIRVGRTTCRHCGYINPPWGHVNRFDDSVLAGLFRPFRVTHKQMVGMAIERTSRLASRLMDYAGNPWGYYGFGDNCLHCGACLDLAPKQRISQRFAAKIAHQINSFHRRLAQTAPIWIHMRFSRP